MTQVSSLFHCPDLFVGHKKSDIFLSRSISLKTYWESVYVCKRGTPDETCVNTFSSPYHGRNRPKRKVRTTFRFINLLCEVWTSNSDGCPSTWLHCELGTYLWPSSSTRQTHQSFRTPTRCCRPPPTGTLECILTLCCETTRRTGCPWRTNYWCRKNRCSQTGGHLCPTGCRTDRWPYPTDLDLVSPSLRSRNYLLGSDGTKTRLNCLTGPRDPTRRSPATTTGAKSWSST